MSALTGERSGVRPVTDGTASGRHANRTLEKVEVGEEVEPFADAAGTAGGDQRAVGVVVEAPAAAGGVGAGVGASAVVVVVGGGAAQHWANIEPPLRTALSHSREFKPEMILTD